MYSMLYTTTRLDFYFLIFDIKMAKVQIVREFARDK